PVSVVNNNLAQSLFILSTRCVPILGIGGGLVFMFRPYNSRMGSQLFWLIRGYNSTECIFEKRVAIGQFTNEQIRDVLKALTAKASLSYSEIIGAYASRRTKAHTHLLDIHRDPTRATFLCGTNPHFVASVIDGEGNVIIHPNSP